MFDILQIIVEIINNLFVIIVKFVKNMKYIKYFNKYINNNLQLIFFLIDFVHFL